MKLLRFESSNHLLGRAALALALTFALGSGQVAAQALSAQDTAAPPLAETDGAATNTTGTGTKGKIPVWTSATALGNSIITQINGKIGIGAANPPSLLTVDGNDPAAATIRGANTSSGKGVVGISASGTGVAGTSTSGVAVQGSVTGPNNIHAAVLGETSSTADVASGVTGRVTSDSSKFGSAGVRGENKGDGFGVEGVSNKRYGVYGHGGPDSGGVGVFGTSSRGSGVSGISDTLYGVAGVSHDSAGVFGMSWQSTGVAGESITGTGVTGQSDGGYGVYGISKNSFAGVFDGNVQVNGTLSKSAGSFRIDHPLDPANEYLSHSFVESPEMMNIYNGNITTDARGFAVVQMPPYFSALNRDFRYQLTVIGQFAQAIVATEITENTFRIRTSKPKVKVSWLVTGVRHDAYAEAHRVQVVEPKAFADRGRYLFPTGFGQPESATIGRPELAAQVAPPSVGSSGGGR